MEENQGKHLDRMHLNSNILRSSIVACALLCPILLLGQGKTAIVSSTDAQIVVDYYPSRHAPQSVSVNGRPSLYFPESELTSKPGDEGVPRESFLVGIPPNGGIRIEVLEEQLSGSAPGRIAPVPELSISNDSLRLVERRFVQGVSASPSSSQPVSVDEVFWWRYQRVARVSVRSISVDVAGETYKTRERIRLKVSFTGTTADAKPASPELIRMEETYKKLLVNYEQAKSWRSVAPAGSQAADTTGNWFVPGQEFVKIPLARDGLYRFSYSDLVAAGALPSSLSLQTADLYSRGRSLSFRVMGDADGVFGPGDSIEFFGSRLYDSTRIPNEYTDTSAYWLTFSGSGRRRAIVETTVDPTPDVTATFFNATYRMEKDSFYFFGNGGLPVNNQSAKVLGEGWYWKRILANQTATIPWTSNHFYKTGNPSYVLRGRLHSPVNNTPPASPEHDVTVRVNGTIAGTILFNDNADTVFALTVPSALFLEGANSITIRSNPTAASLNEVFLDWLEIDCQKLLAADADTLVFSADYMTPNQVGLFQIDGFSGPDIEVFRIGQFGDVEKVFRGNVTGSSLYTMSFSDTIQTGKRYFAVTSGKKRTPPVFQLKTFGNLRSPTPGADYLVITSRELLPAANQLASYRSQTGIGRTAVVTAEDIYDEFNYGLFSPAAIRSFILAVDTLWSAPAPSLIVLFGDANWDYKNFLTTARKNHVPSLGNPVSDAWLTAPASDLFLPQKEVGRIPASNLGEGLDFVSSLIQYEAGPLSQWNKTFMFMVSGFDSAETAIFSQFSESMISQNIIPAPISGVASRLYRKVQVAGTTESEEVRRILESGAVWINFYGHAGTDAWGNGLSQAADLINNEGKRHLVSDVSCSTVRFAEPLVESFSEKLLFASQGGAVAYLGSSGFGFETPLRYMAKEFYDGMAKDTVREIGTLLLRGKLALYALGTGSVINQEALQQYTLLGDPATRIAIAAQPDYSLNSDEIVVDPSQPSEADNTVTIRFALRNFGLRGIDSVVARVTHSVEGGAPDVFDVKRGGVGLVDTVSLSEDSFRKPGFHSISIEADPGSLIGEENETNNRAQGTFFVGSGQLHLLSPPSFSSLHPDSILLAVVNPNNPQTALWKVVFEVDTVLTFGSPALIRNELSQPGVVTSSWQVPQGVLSDNTVYFWRSQLAGPTDSTEWRQGIFSTSSAQKRRWIQNRSSLFAANVNDQIAVSGIPALRHQRLPAEILSAGFDDGNEARILFDGVNISQGFSNRGYNIAIIDQNSGELDSYAAFSIYSDFTDTTLAEPLIQFLDAVPYGKRVLVGVADEGSRNKTERLNAAFESIGSSQIRLLGFRGSWAVSGWKGASIGSVPEVITSSGGGPAMLVDTIDAKSVRGTMLTPLIGPVSSWNDIAVSADTVAGLTHVSVDMLRTLDGGTRDTIRGISIQRDSLFKFMAGNVAAIQLRAVFESDSAGVSPLLNSWFVDYTPAAELALSYQTTSIPADSVDEGEQVTIQASVHNVGYSDADSVSLTGGVFLNNQLSVFSQTTIPLLTAGSASTHSISYNSAGSRGPVSFLLQVNQNGRVRESIPANNAMSLSAFVLGDTIAPAFDVLFDGARIVEGDYVNPSPEIRISVRDNSPLPITNPTNIDLRLDNRRVTLGPDPDSLFQTGSGIEKASVVFRPSLNNGAHLISVQVLDASGNPADTAAVEIRFQVENRARLRNVVNIPNPFASETAFTFQLSGPTQPDAGTLRIYTVGGRLVYERTLYPGEVKLGFNQLVWNGRDRDGDEIANGVYFYKISVRMGATGAEVIEKLAKLR